MSDKEKAENMGRKDLIAEVSKRTEVSLNDTELVIDTTLEVIGESVAAGTSVNIMGFGSFVSRFREARTGRNPHTGSTLNIPAKTVIVFKAGKALKATVDKQ